MSSLLMNFIFFQAFPRNGQKGNGTNDKVAVWCITEDVSCIENLYIDPDETRVLNLRPVRGLLFKCVLSSFKSGDLHRIRLFAILKKYPFKEFIFLSLIIYDYFKVI